MVNATSGERLSARIHAARKQTVFQKEKKKTLSSIILEEKRRRIE